MSPCILAFNSNSESKFKPICSLTGLVSDRRGRIGAAVAARPGASVLLGFLFRRRRRLPDDEEPVLEEMSDSCSWRRRSSMESFDVPFGISCSALWGAVSFIGMVIRRWN